MVSKNLFPYNVSFVSILKNEGPYLKEWLDYHILAGVDHFYIYDNESTDSTKEILKPYIESKVVTYNFWPGTCQQYPVSNDALRKYRYSSKFLAYLDGDEFLFPQKNKTISEVVEEIFAANTNAGTLIVNMHNYGSNYQEKADYSRGVLERFTRCAKKTDDENYNPPNGRAGVKNILNPRCVDFIDDPHLINPIIGRDRINEYGQIVRTWGNTSVVYDKIVINHYYCKSREEFIIRVGKGDAVYGKKHYDKETFDKNIEIHNAEFDDSILKYRQNLINKWGGVPLRKVNYPELYMELMHNLSPTFIKSVPKEFFIGKMETFLACRALSSYLKENFLDEKFGNFLEESSLKAIHGVFQGNMQIAELKMLFDELPNILPLNYPVVQDIRNTCINIIPQLVKFFQSQRRWKDAEDLNFLMSMLQTFKGL